MRLLFAFLLPASTLLAQAPLVTGVYNAASLDNRLAPGCVAIVHGSNLGTGEADVTIGGQSAPVIIGTPTDIYVQIPFELSTGGTTATVTVSRKNSAPFNVNLGTYAPGLSSFDYTGQGIGTFTLPNNAFVSLTTPATPTQNITLFATGLGPTNPAVPSGTPNQGAPTATMPTVTVGGETVKINSSTLSGTLFGYYEVNFQVPGDLPEGNAPVVLNMGGQISNRVLLPIGKPTPLLLNVVNGASFAATNVVAPGELIAINAGNLGKDDMMNVFPATSVEGITVTLASIQMPLVHVLPSAGRVLAVVPTEILDTGNTTITATNLIGVGSLAVRQAAAAPGMFRIQDPSKPTRLNALATFANTSWRVVPASMATALGWPNSCKGTDIDPSAMCGQPATQGDNIQVFVTGLGKATPDGDPAGTPLATGQVAPADSSTVYQTLLHPTVTVGGVSTPVQFSGLAPGYAWLYVVSFQIPKSAPAGDDVPVVVNVPGFGSDTATISIH
jgi:uncharacterized protein (TIGR03437 family)